MPRIQVLLILLALLLVPFGLAEGADRRTQRTEVPRRAWAAPAGSLSLRSGRGSDVLDRYIEGVMANKHIPGFAGAIAKDGRIVWKGAFGYGDLNLKKPATDDTLFILASITKTLTATSLMQLYDQGLFDLHDPVNDYLPFRVSHPSHGGTDITFFMLLTHSSGIKDNWGVMPYYNGDSPIPLAAYLEDYLTPGGAYYAANKNFYAWEPGTNFGYCNIAVALMGYLVEVLSGLPLEDYAQQNVFGPVGMKETSYFLANLNVNHVAVPYYWSGNQYVKLNHYGYSDYPSGQVRTSSTQLMNFLWIFWQNQFNQEGPTVFLVPGADGNDTGFGPAGPPAGPSQNQGQNPFDSPDFARILKPDTVKEMVTPQIPQIDPTQGLIWHGWTLNGRKLWGHAGGDQGATTEMWFWPDENTGIVALTNGEAYFFEILNAMFEYAEGL